MVRNYKKKCPETTPADLMRTAVRIVIDEKKSVREVAKTLSIPRTTLIIYIEKKKARNKEGEIDYRKTTAAHQVFTASEESVLDDYLITASKHHSGLTKTQCRDLAWRCAKKCGWSYPAIWYQNKHANENWVSGFMKMHKKLSRQKMKRQASVAVHVSTKKMSKVFLIICKKCN